MRTKVISILIAVLLLAGMFTMSLTVSAASKNDTTPPTLSVKLNGEKLTVSAKDDDSGLQAIFIDSTRVNSLVNGKATVNLKDYAGKDKKISVYAMDYVGNKSDVKKIDNPYYTEPATVKATEAPQQATTTSKSTSQSSGSSRSNSSQSGGSNQNASNNTATTPTINSTSRILPSPTTSSVSSISVGALTPNGQGTVLVVFLQDDIVDVLFNFCHGVSVLILCNMAVCIRGHGPGGDHDVRDSFDVRNKDGRQSGDCILHDDINRRFRSCRRVFVFLLRSVAFERIIRVVFFRLCPGILRKFLSDNNA